MNWRQRKQFKIASIFFGTIFIVLAIIIIPKFFNSPTCNDGKFNGQELGIDCGGKCVKLCPSQTKEVVVLWTRIFKISDGFYNAVAYLENQNINATAIKIPYEFRVYDEKNVFIDSIEGQTSIAPNGKTIVFTSDILTGNRIPKRIFFSFLDQGSVWLKTDNKLLEKIKLSIDQKEIINVETKPKISAILNNHALNDLQEVLVAVIIYDEKDNAIAVSQTKVSNLRANSSQNIFFTWPNPFEEIVGRIEILPMVDLSNL